MKPKLLTLLILLILPIKTIQAQAIWNGKYYSSRVCPNPNCRMCNSIQRQLNEQQIVKETPIPIVKTEEPKGETKKERRSRQVTAYKTEFYTVRICHGKRKPCTYETRSRQVPYQKTEYYYVDVPVTTVKAPTKAPEKPKPSVVEKPKNTVFSMLREIRSEVKEDRLTKTEYVPTPKEELLKLFPEIYIPSDAVFYEVGCGEGDTLQYFHAQYSLRNSYGIELDRDLAQKARLNNPASQILLGDARDYTYLNATHVYMYLYPELMDKVIPLLPKNTTIISYSHKLPESLSPRKIGNFYIATK